jgi:transcriptional antiterminator RfaH
VSRWYCAYTKPGAELWARANLWERGFEVYLPQHLKRRRHARRTDYVAAPLFPRYLFVAADLDTGVSRGITYAPGVSNLIAFGGDPAPVPDAVISELRAHEGDDGMMDLDRGRGIASRYQPGDKVRIAEGPMADSVGIFHAQTAYQRVFILMELLGRQVQVKVHARALSPEN